MRGDVPGCSGGNEGIEIVGVCHTPRRAEKGTPIVREGQTAAGLRRGARARSRDVGLKGVLARICAGVVLLKHHLEVVLVADVLALRGRDALEVLPAGIRGSAGLDKGVEQGSGKGLGGWIGVVGEQLRAGIAQRSGAADEVPVVVLRSALIVGRGSRVRRIVDAEVDGCRGGPAASWAPVRNLEEDYDGGIAVAIIRIRARPHPTRSRWKLTRLRPQWKGGQGEQYKYEQRPDCISPRHTTS